MNNLYDEQEQAKIREAIKAFRRKYPHKRYFSDFATEYELIERVEREVDRYRNGELGKDTPTSDVEIAKFFGVRNYSVQRFLAKMDEGKRDIKAKVCLKVGQDNGWPYLRDSGKIPLLEGRVRDAAIKAIKKKWGKL